LEHESGKERMKTPSKTFVVKRLKRCCALKDSVETFSDGTSKYMRVF